MCDGCRPGFYAEARLVQDPRGSAAGLLVLAEQQGWTFRRGLWFCPTCAASLPDQTETAKDGGSGDALRCWRAWCPGCGAKIACFYDLDVALTLLSGGRGAHLLCDRCRYAGPAPAVSSADGAPHGGHKNDPPRGAPHNSCQDNAL